MTKSSWLRRILVGAVLGVAVFAAIFSYRQVIAVVTAAWVVLATFEFIQLLGRAEIRLSHWLLPVLNVMIVAAAYFGWLPGFLLAPIAVVLLAAVAMRETKPRVPVYGAFCLIYLGFFPAHLVLLKNLAVSRCWSPWIVFFPLALTWLNDTAGLVFGKLTGRHKLSPTISPNKTVEGYVAGLVFSAALSAVYLHFLVPFSTKPIWWLAVVGIGLGTVAQAGDLFESMFKRAVGVKDTSSALADHGGFLDRVDSLLFTIPAFYYLVLYLD
ncbi:MAG: phosphatidate cytidylyltransferase [candidate division WOR-3 bacterium]|nr:phosphatidate cytidylyltransferase [candidate division WOR-3 bacterium]